MTRSALVLSLALLCGSASLARAELVCARPTIQLPDCRAGMPLAWRFTFRCTGTTGVIITEAKPSCGCLTPRLDQRRLVPGDEGTVSLEVNTLTQTAGPHAWRVTLIYREGDQQKDLPLTVCANVIAELQVEPATVILATDSTLRHQLTLTERRLMPINLLQVQATRPGLRVTIEPARQLAPREWKRGITVEVLDTFPSGRFDEVIQLVSDDVEYRELKIPVTVIKRARGAVAAAPSRIDFSGRPGEPLASQRVLLMSREDREVLVDRVEADHPAVQCLWAAGQGQSTTLKISVDPSKVTAQELAAVVTVRLRGPTAEPLQIPVTVRLAH